MTTPRRNRAWIDFNVDSNLAAGAELVSDLLLNATVNLDTITVTRIIGRMLCLPSVVANNTVSAQIVSVGIGVSSNEAFNVGTTAIPDPNVANEAPPRGWLWKDRGVLVNQQDSGTVEAWHFPEFRFDVRAQRKVDRGTLFIKFVNQDLLAGTTAIKIAGLVRVLCLT